MITATLIGDREVIARFSAMPGNVHQGVVRTVTSLTMQLKALVQRKLSGEVLQVRSGRLRGSINGRVQESATSVTGTVSTDVPYAKYQELGVPHEWKIPAKTARALAFEVGGETIFAKWVIHKALPARSFMASSLHEMEPIILAELGSTVRDTVSAE